MKFYCKPLDNGTLIPPLGITWQLNTPDVGLITFGIPNVSGLLGIGGTFVNGERTQLLLFEVNNKDLTDGLSVTCAGATNTQSNSSTAYLSGECFYRKSTVLPKPSLLTPPGYLQSKFVNERK